MENKLRSEAEQQAHEHSCKLLLNCYIRELALEKESDIRIHPNTLTYAVAFQASGVKVTGQLAYHSAMGEHEYLSMQSGGEAVHYRDLVRWITCELGGDGAQGASSNLHGMLKSEMKRKSSLEVDIAHPLGENTNRVELAYARDFAQKVDNSVGNLTLYIEQAAGLDIHDYCTSEQSLLYGHPFHPFPKNSKGFSEQDVQKYSPELRTSFQLCYIAVRQDVYVQEWVDDEAVMDLPNLLRSHVEPILKEKSGMYGLLPVHPWQYAYISQLSEVQHYIRDERLILLGSAGPIVYPTSSVRTVYIPAWNCNIKLSLNMQITNMIRTNSAEQMRRTLDASNYVRQHDCFGAEPHTHIAYETGVATCAFDDEELTSLFTIAYRPIEFDPANTYVLSSLVEAPLPGMRSRLMTLLGGDLDIAERWLDRYMACSLLPIVRAAGEKGIHFEAHLQNTLVTLEDGLPVDFIVRDLEGVSVDEELISEQERAVSDLLFYSREKAWARTSYYFIVNHLGSLIHAMARDVNVPEEHFWKQVREVLVDELERTGNEYVRHLLTTDAFLAKQNLVSCLRGISQTPAYVPVSNVMKRIGSEVRGSRGIQG
ncbi:IucA/IucC family siderophore biosynthesis protein [Paenibacillus xylanexedens]|uniref:IucA/IucC family protein n=1 Tax=Paenibacillus xylanexedens TaxID=528191 RepID=UPI0021B5FBF5|nr:IucA/IucC family protein [Paenibacillus xylanexedens]